VQILTSRSQSPQQEWLNFVTTSKAKTKIEVALRKQRKEKIKKGEQILLASYQQAGVENNIQILNKMLAYYGYPKKEDLYYAVAEKQVELTLEDFKKILREKSNNYFMNFMKQAFSVGSNSKEVTEGKNAEIPVTDVDKIDRTKTYILEEEEFQKNYIAANCCNPIPGDDVLGFIHDDERLKIHKRACPVALKLKTRFGDRIVSCEWAGHKASSFPGTIEIKGHDRLGILSEIAQAISKDLSVNVRKLNIISGDGFFEGTIEVAIHDVKEIKKLIKRLRKIKDVESVIRVDS
jgi:GTP pyrophosphokinase